MEKNSRLSLVILNLILIVSLVTIWLAFAPTRAGGRAAYVMVNGNSMEPGFHRGDLAIVRKAGIYQVGDVVTYRDARMGAFVIHRIIGVEQDHYILKGDNNSWIDAYHPTQEEIIGKLWVHAPKLGRAMEWLRLPVNTALIIGLLGGILMVSMMTQPSKNGKRKLRTSGSSVGWFEPTLYTLGFMALVFLALSIYAFGNPVTRAADDIKYQQSGAFFYSAAGAPGIYDSDTLHSGEPIFPRLTCFVNIGFAYTVAGDQIQDVVGTQQLNARVTDEKSGWQRTIPLQGATTFSGNSYSTMSTLDLCQVQALVASVEEETGFRPMTYTLTVTPHVAITGKAAGQDLYDSFDANLVFDFDEVHFYLANKDPEVDPFRSYQEGFVNNPGTQANMISVLGIKFNVLAARILGTAGLLISLVSLLFLGLYVFEISKRSPEALIRIKYGSMLMDVSERGFDSIASMIEVPTVEDLVKLAERQNAMIMHITRDHRQYYLVQSNGTTYRYALGDNQNNTVNYLVQQNENVFAPIAPKEIANIPQNKVLPLSNGSKKMLISRENPGLSEEPIEVIKDRW